jgi:hypothetical protein
MADKTKLGGAVCPQYSDLYIDSCKNCLKPIVAINEQRVIEGCICLKPDLKGGTIHRIETSKIVDALGIVPDGVEA